MAKGKRKCSSKAKFIKDKLKQRGLQQKKTSRQLNLSSFSNFSVPQSTTDPFTSCPLRSQSKEPASKANACSPSRNQAKAPASKGNACSPSGSQSKAPAINSNARSVSESV